MTLYIDVIWFLNLCIDYLLIALTSLVLKRRFHHIRMILAAFVASLVVFLMFTPFSWMFYEPWMKLVYSMLIVVIAYGYKRFRYFLQGLLMFYFVAFMTGGGLFALHFFWQSETEILKGIVKVNSGFGSGISWIFVCLGFPLLWYFSKHRFTDIEMKKVQYDQLVEVDISLAGYTFRTKGLLDSGNQLSDPLTKKPVMIIEAKLLHPYFKKEQVDQLLHFHEGIGDQDTDTRSQLMDIATIVPYRVIGQSSPFLTALRPDKIKVYYQKETFETANVLLGLQDKELSPDGAFSSIIHPKLVLGVSTEKLA
ncbi:sigma-E processing peptidase SpoIIGA [Bacillus suaedae]|uniref:Sporulation sigma-E factor-processing peptidase n=1 Tax=Halalkalibacter suaedae TaxID=2822140 RepID=A0A940WX10_9BACI|nr:sigma-E processing peptidase SpoIIGA [Bacillus suaedae]MBP3952117.1 sigma-E processing peptidase SpoIIGA [Bacillus suaedae]